MGRILEDWRLTLATIFSVALIAGAYFFARDIESPSVAQASEETALLQAIAAKDSDGDGLPNWEEALYGTDPNVVDTFRLGMADGEAVAKGLIVPKAIADIPAAAADTSINYAAIGLPKPTEGTLTDIFAKNFFTLYLSAKRANGGADLTNDQTNALAGQAMGQLSQMVAPASDFKKAADIKVSGSGPDALRVYAAASEAVILAHIPQPQPSKNQIQYLQGYLNNGDRSALDTLRAMAAFYRDAAIGLSAIAAPGEMAATHLSLINAFARAGGEIRDFSRIDSDPFAAMFALGQHPQTIAALTAAFTDVARIFAAANIVLVPGTKGATFVNLIRDRTSL